MTREELLANPAIKKIIEAVTVAYSTGGSERANEALASFRSIDPGAYITYLEFYVAWLEEELVRFHASAPIEQLLVEALHRRKS